MNKIELQNITIAYYCKMLRANSDKEMTALIDGELSKSLDGLAGGFDLSLFMLQKDLLIFQCKLAISILNFDDKLVEFYEKKIKAIREEIEKKTKQSETEKPNPYKSFLSWILSVEKYLGFSIDRNNDLLYFTEATKQMLNHYESQKKQYEDNKAKNNRK